MVDSTPRVSVIVPVYNPGVHIEPLLASLAAQTLPQPEFETVFVDDGSTDETPQRLDRLAAEQDNVTVVHEPNSGWPGRPRNVGIDRARGRYVFFADQDDWLGVEALQRMADYADAHRSDILIGRYAGHRRTVAKHLFVDSRPAATLADTPLMDSLTPHKLFRTAFLDKHALRFPEGRRRLEDHVFVTKAYFLASRISILADYHCYFHIRRADDGNAAFQRIDPVGYYENVKEVIDIVLAHTQPGGLRDEALRRSLRSEVLGRLDGRAFLTYDANYRHSLFDQARSVAVQLPHSVDDGLPAPHRTRAWLLREGRLEDLGAYIAQELRIGADLRLVDLGWADDGSLTLDVEGGLVNRPGNDACTYQRDGDILTMATPDEVDDPVPRHVVECTDALRSAEISVSLRRRDNSEEWRVPGTSHIRVHEDDGHVWLSYRVTARIDPLTLASGRPLPGGIWDVYGKVTQTGWTREVRIGAQRSPQASSGAMSALLAGQLITPYWTDPHGNLSVDVTASPDRLIRDLRAGPPPVSLARERDADTTTVRLAMRLFVPPVTPRAAGAGATIRLSNEPDGDTVDLDTHCRRVGRDAVHIWATLPRLGRGHWRVSVRLTAKRWDNFRSTGAAIAIPRIGQPAVTAGQPVQRWGAPSASIRSRQIYRRVRRRLVRFRRQAE